MLDVGECLLFLSNCSEFASLSFTAIMVNRLYISLKEVGQEEDDDSELTAFTSHRQKTEQVGLRVMLSTDITSTIRFVVRCSLSQTAAPTSGSSR